MSQDEYTAIKLVEELLDYSNGWVFRGHRDCSWNLHSTLERIFIDNSDFKKNAVIAEQSTLDMIKARAHHYFSNDSSPSSEFGWLSLAQHYGAPTRLLDFSENPFAALYFATRDFLNCSSDFCLWCFDFRRINLRCGKMVSERSGMDTDGMIDRDPDGFFDIVEKLPDSKKDGLAWIGEPRRRNVRIERQAGTFLVTAQPNSRIEELLDTPIFENAYHKKIIPSDLRIKVVRLLLRSSTTGSTMFNDLAGLGSDIHDQLALFVNHESQKPQY
jgi:hypothetical protein